MDIKLKYRAWVGEKHADISSPLTNSDIETFAIEFAEWLVKNCFISDVKQRCISFAEWCVKENFTYYFNGKEWIWGHARRQEYYTSEELYDKWLNNVA